MNSVIFNRANGLFSNSSENNKFCWSRRFSSQRFPNYTYTTYVCYGSVARFISASATVCARDLSTIIDIFCAFRDSNNYEIHANMMVQNIIMYMEQNIVYTTYNSKQTNNVIFAVFFQVLVNQNIRNRFIFRVIMWFFSYHREAFRVDTICSGTNV